MHYKRHRPKQTTIRDCGSRTCRYDKGKLIHPNGKDRYLPRQWRQMPFFETKNPWRHPAKEYRDYDIGQIPY